MEAFGVLGKKNTDMSDTSGAEKHFLQQRGKIICVYVTSTAML